MSTSEVIFYSSPKPGYHRGLLIENGRLLSSRYTSELPLLRPEVLKNPCLQAKLNASRRKFDWIWKRYPKRTERLWKAKGDWCASTGRDDDGWWQEMVERFAP